MATTTAMAIRDFTVEVPQADTDLGARIAATRFPEHAFSEVGAAR